MEKEKSYRMSDIEEVISEFDDVDIPEDVLEIDDDFRIVVEGWYVYLPSLNLSLRMGIACVLDEECGEYMPDFDVTVVYEGQLEDDMWLYYEQDGMAVTLGNWLNGRLSMDEILNLECRLVVPEE